MTDQLWINTDRTVLVTRWQDGTMEVAVREHAGDIWGPPVTVTLETTTTTAAACRTCGHHQADHKSNRAPFPHPLRFGVCLTDGCTCREYND